MVYTPSLHDALPIYAGAEPTTGVTLARQRGQPVDGEDDETDGDRDPSAVFVGAADEEATAPDEEDRQDRKSTRLNSSHLVNSYAVFCVKKNSKTCR